MVVVVVDDGLFERARGAKHSSRSLLLDNGLKLVAVVVALVGSSETIESQDDDDVLLLWFQVGSNSTSSSSRSFVLLLCSIIRHQIDRLLFLCPFVPP